MSFLVCVRSLYWGLIFGSCSVSNTLFKASSSLRLECKDREPHLHKKHQFPRKKRTNHHIKYMYANSLVLLALCESVSQMLGIFARLQPTLFLPFMSC